MVSGLSKFDKINLIGDTKARVSQTLQRLPPIDVVLILLGTNDLCRFREKGGKEVARDVLDLGLLFLHCGVK